MDLFLNGGDLGLLDGNVPGFSNTLVIIISVSLCQMWLSCCCCCAWADKMCWCRSVWVVFSWQQTAVVLFSLMSMIAVVWMLTVCQSSAWLTINLNDRVAVYFLVKLQVWKAHAWKRVMLKFWATSNLPPFDSFLYYSNQCRDPLVDWICQYLWKARIMWLYLWE